MARAKAAKTNGVLLPGDTPFEYPTSYAQTEPFTKPHTVTVLLGLFVAFVYALNSDYEKIDNSREANISRGLIGALALGLVFCAEHLRDTLFVRPHPALWRFVTGCGLFYAMALAFALFQSLPDLRAIMGYLDPKHSGHALPEKSYGEDCSFTWENVKGSTDEFVIAHLLGWAFKAAMIRDVRISMLISLLFEVMEYTFTYLQPNFNECWWDHWILDFVLCNTGGIIIGHLVMSYLDSKEYNWVGIAEIPSVGGKVKRLLGQFTPYTWMRYEWHAAEDLKRFGCVFFMVVGVMICELDAFFLKFILHVQPKSPLNVYRLLLWWAVGMVALRDYYAFITDPKIKRLGSTCWVVLAMLVMELAVVVRFGVSLPEWQGKVPPTDVVYAWTATGVVFLASLIWWFGVALPQRRLAAGKADSAAPAEDTGAGIVPPASAVKKTYAEAVMGSSAVKKQRAASPSPAKAPAAAAAAPSPVAAAPPSEKKQRATRSRSSRSASTAAAAGGRSRSRGAK